MITPHITTAYVMLIVCTTLWLVALICFMFAAVFESIRFLAVGMVCMSLARILNANFGVPH